MFEPVADSAAGARGITVALVEDEPAISERLQHAVAQSPLLRLVYHCATAGEAMAWLQAHEVDVMLVDLGLPDRPGLEVIARCRELRPACQVMVVTMFADESHIVSAFEAGATGYLLKDGAESDLADHVQQLHAGGSPMSPMIARQLLRRWQGLADVPVPPSGPREALTTREAEVLELVARGFTYVEAAARLSMAVSTVRTHVRNVYTKLDVHNKTEAVFEARQLGLLR